MLTGGVPASYGRFSGGVVNVITRSGGNTFSGSFRQNLSNPAWIAETPRQVQNNIEHPDLLGRTYEGTFGGPVALDRLWFFTAGRYEQMNIANTFTQTASAYTRTDTNRRGEVEADRGRPAAGQMVQVSYITNHTRQANASGLAAAASGRCQHAGDANACRTTSLPPATTASLPVGTLQPRSCRGRRRDSGTTVARAPPFTTRPSRRSARPPACRRRSSTMRRISMPPTRKTATTTRLRRASPYLLSTDRSGSHDLKGGVESFVNRAIGGNSQSSTGYVFVTDYLVQGGRPVAERRWPTGPGLHSRRVAGVELHGDARRDAEHPHDVAVPAGPLGGVAAAHARPWRPRRNRPRARRPVTSPP